MLRVRPSAGGARPTPPRVPPHAREYGPDRTASSKWMTPGEVSCAKTVLNFSHSYSVSVWHRTTKGLAKPAS